MLLKHLNFVLFARQAVAGRSINRITEQYAVIANCDPTRASYASADYRKLHWARLCVSPLIQLHYSRRTRCMTPASITIEIRFAGTAKLFGRFRLARKRIETRMKTNGVAIAPRIETIPPMLCPTGCSLDYKMPAVLLRARCIVTGDIYRVYGIYAHSCIEGALRVAQGRRGAQYGS